MMGRMLVALMSTALVDHVLGFNPLPVAPVHSAPKVQPRTAPNGVGPVMQTMPGRRPSFLPSMPAGSSGQETAPMLAQEVEEAAWPEPQMRTAKETTNPMQADGGSWYEGFAAGIFAGIFAGSISGIVAGIFAFSGVFLALRTPIQRQSPAAPQLDAVEMRQTPLLSGQVGTLQGAQVAYFSPHNTGKPSASAFTLRMQQDDGGGFAAKSQDAGPEQTSTKRVGASIDADGKSNVWAVEPKMQVENPDATPAIALAAAVAAAAAAAAATAKVIGTNVEY